jgi:hypothetical protein
VRHHWTRAVVLEETSGVIANGYLRLDPQEWIRAVEKWPRSVGKTRGPRACRAADVPQQKTARTDTACSYVASEQGFLATDSYLVRAWTTLSS